MSYSRDFVESEEIPTLSDHYNLTMNAVVVVYMDSYHIVNCSFEKKY